MADLTRSTRFLRGIPHKAVGRKILLTRATRLFSRTVEQSFLVVQGGASVAPGIVVSAPVVESASNGKRSGWINGHIDQTAAFAC